MIKSFKSKALADLFQVGKSGKIDTRLLPGFDFHPLRGFRPIRYTIHVNGPWCLTFEFDGKDAAHVDLEQYH